MRGALGAVFYAVCGPQEEAKEACGGVTSWGGQARRKARKTGRFWAQKTAGPEPRIRGSTWHVGMNESSGGKRLREMVVLAG